MQVGDTLTFRYKIILDLMSALYFITPETSDASKHQKNDSDYELICEQKKVSDMMTEKKEGKFKLYIKKPESFQNKFTLRTINDNSIDVPGINVGEIVFNAVKINAYSYTVQTRKVGVFNHSVWKYYNKIYID